MLSLLPVPPRLAVDRTGLQARRSGGCEPPDPFCGSRLGGGAALLTAVASATEFPEWSNNMKRARWFSAAAATAVLTAGFALTASAAFADSGNGNAGILSALSGNVVNAPVSAPIDLC